MIDVVRAPLSLSKSEDDKQTLFPLDNHQCTGEINGNFMAFKKECSQLGISLDDVNNAEKQSVAFYKKWWWNDDKKYLLDNIEKDDGEEDDKFSIGAPNNCSNILLKPNLVLLAAPSLIIQAKTEALVALRKSFGDTRCSHFQFALRALSSIYRNTKKVVDIKSFDGEWLTLSRPNFQNCLGQNVDGDFVYTLGRMSFDMFRPANLRCSIKKTIVKTSEVAGEKINLDNLTIPWTLRKEISHLVEQQHQQSTANNKDLPHQKITEQALPLRTFDIVTYFVVEPKDSQISAKNEETKQELTEECIAPSKPLKAKMTSYGYILPDPKSPNRFSIWFTGGVIAPVSGNTTKLDKKNKRRSSFETMTTCDKNEVTDVDHDNKLKLDRKLVSGFTCPLPLQECRLKNKHCALHGVQKMSRNKQNAVNKFVSRYKRPSYGTGRHAGLKGSLQLGNLAQPHSMEWEDIFAPEDNWKRSMGEYAKALAAKAFLGADVPDRMEDDGSMEFRLNRPISAHIDVLYMDDDIRITRGHHGTIYVHVRNTIYKKTKTSNSK